MSRKIRLKRSRFAYSWDNGDGEPDVFSNVLPRRFMDIATDPLRIASSSNKRGARHMELHGWQLCLTHPSASPVLSPTLGLPSSPPQPHSQGPGAHRQIHHLMTWQQDPFSGTALPCSELTQASGLMIHSFFFHLFNQSFPGPG